MLAVETYCPRCRGRMITETIHGEVERDCLACGYVEVSGRERALAIWQYELTLERARVGTNKRRPRGGSHLA